RHRRQRHGLQLRGDRQRGEHGGEYGGGRPVHHPHPQRLRFLQPPHHHREQRPRQRPRPRPPQPPRPPPPPPPPHPHTPHRRSPPAAGSGCSGILVPPAGVVRAHGTGMLTLDGTGGNGTDSNHGVIVGRANTEVSTAGGDLSVTGTGKGSTVNNRGISVENG